MTIELRAATAADLDAIDLIEQHSFSRPWPRATFEAELTREWAHVDVLLLDGTIVLSGNVRSYAERQEAERAAWAAPGVKLVEDRLLIVP